MMENRSFVKSMLFYRIDMNLLICWFLLVKFVESIWFFKWPIADNQLRHLTNALPENAGKFCDRWSLQKKQSWETQLRLFWNEWNKSWMPGRQKGIPLFDDWRFNLKSLDIICSIWICHVCPNSWGSKHHIIIYNTGMHLRVHWVGESPNWRVTPSHLSSEEIWPVMLLGETDLEICFTLIFFPPAKR